VEFAALDVRDQGLYAKAAKIREKERELMAMECSKAGNATQDSYMTVIRRMETNIARLRDGDKAVTQQSFRALPG